MKEQTRHRLFSIKRYLDKFTLATREESRRTDSDLNKKLSGEVIGRYRNIELYIS